MFDNPALFAAILSGAYSPSSLFAAGEQGAWYDPSDFSTMFQDDAGATPVTATGQAVGRILDKSGRGNHATQATLASRPILRQDASGRYYLEFDGTDDSISVATLDLTGTNKISIFLGIHKASDAAASVAVEHGPNSVGANAGTFGVFAPGAAASPTFQFVNRGASTGPTATSPSTYAAPITVVLSALGDLGAPSATLRLNASQVANTTNATGGGNYTSRALNIGRRNGATVPFNGRIYSFIVRGAASSTAEIANAESWVNSKTGAY
jgi:hypothetical protein